MIQICGFMDIAALWIYTDDVEYFVSVIKPNTWMVKLQNDVV